MSSIFRILDMANNSLQTEREVMAYSAENVANAYTPGYKAKTPILQSRGKPPSFSEMVEYMAEGRDIGLNSVILNEHPGSGTRVSEVAVDTSKGSMMYLPNHPLADKNGYVESSNVDAPAESIKMMKAVNSYKTILSIVEMAKSASKEAMNMTKTA